MGDAAREPMLSADGAPRSESSGLTEEGMYMLFEAPARDNAPSVSSATGPTPPPTRGTSKPAPAPPRAAPVLRETGALERALSAEVFGPDHAATPTDKPSSTASSSRSLFSRIPAFGEPLDRTWALREIAWLSAAGILSVAGAAYGAAPPRVAFHAEVRSVCYLVSILAAAGVAGRALDWLAFALLDAAASLSVPAALVFYYVSAFRGVPANLFWVALGLGCYEDVLADGVPLRPWLNALLVCGAIAIAMGLRALAFRLLLTGLLRGHFESSVEGALRAAVIARALSAPMAWAPQRPPAREDRLRSVAWAALARADFHTHMCRVLRSGFEMYSRDGALVTLPHESHQQQQPPQQQQYVSDLARAAFYRLATRGQTNGPLGPGASGDPFSAGLPPLPEQVAPHWGPHSLLQPPQQPRAARAASLGSPAAAGDVAGAAAGVSPGRLSRTGAAASTPLSVAPLTLSFDDFLAAFSCGSAGGAAPLPPAEAAVLRSLAAQAFGSADDDCDGRVTEAGFVAMVVGLHESWANVRRTLEGHGSAHRLLERLLGVGFWVVAVCAALVAFGVSLAETMMPLATVAIAASFALGRAASDTVVGLVFTLAMHPYDVGDLVSLQPAAGPGPAAPGLADCPVAAAAAGALRVMSVDVLSTSFRQADGRVVVWPNAALYGMTITNLRRSAPPALAVRVTLDAPSAAPAAAADPAAQVEALRAAMFAYVASKPAAWAPGVGVLWGGGGSGGGGGVSVSLTFTLALPWQELPRLAAARSHMVQHLLGELRALGLRGTVLLA